MCGNGHVCILLRQHMLRRGVVAALLKHTYENQIALFFEIMEIIAEGKELPIYEGDLDTGPVTRKQFNELFCVTPANQEMRSRDA